jgi:hypothetical protein
MKQHIIRWVTALHGCVTSLVYLMGEKDRKRAYLDIAEQLEYTAKNIRERVEDMK